jgi:hypothetical protein
MLARKLGPICPLPHIARLSNEYAMNSQRLIAPGYYVTTYVLIASKSGFCLNK